MTSKQKTQTHQAKLATQGRKKRNDGDLSGLVFLGQYARRCLIPMRTRRDADGDNDDDVSVAGEKLATMRKFTRLAQRTTRLRP